MKRRNALTILLYGGLVLFLLYGFRFRIMDIVNNIFDHGYTLENFTMEQKLEDFEEWYLTIVESVPYLDENKELFGIDFVERKEYYIQEIKATQNNVEYYGVMQAVAADVASFHTDVCFPMYSHLQGLSCYQSRETLAAFGMKAKMDAWVTEIGELVKEYDDIEITYVDYVDGKYVTKKHDTWYELVTVDGVPAEQYIVQNISLYDLHYDTQRNKVYRERYILNKSIGRKVIVTWGDEKGNKIEEELYLDHGVNVVAAYGYMFSDDDMPTLSGNQNIITYRDDVNRVEYVKINNFDNFEGLKLRKYLENVQYDKIVIDLRANYGGRYDYAKKHIFPALYGEDINYSYSWSVPDTQANQAMTNDLQVKLMYPAFKKDGFWYYSRTMKYRGEQGETREIYYLVGSGTGSAADGFVSFIKENELGTIVGTNTGGEGLGASYICDSLKNSSLVYIYYPAEYVDTEQTNPCAGVEPDVYLNQTLEDYKLELECIWDGTAEEYENRLKYDTLLKWVIDQE